MTINNKAVLKHALLVLSGERLMNNFFDSHFKTFLLQEQWC